jgi:Nucleotidyl transferase AbiEii toxin, Type IV TA system
MPDGFEPRTEILPKAQQEIWPHLAPAPGLSFVLYGGTAVALYFGHRISVDFDFFRAERFTKRISRRPSLSCAMRKRSRKMRARWL